MNVGRHRIVDAIFEEALDLPPDAQAALLDTRCGTDAALRDEVLELLRLARASAPDFGLPSDAFRHAAMQSAGHAPVSPSNPRNTSGTNGTSHASDSRGATPDDRATEAGERIGGWRVIREIGR